MKKTPIFGESIFGIIYIINGFYVAKTLLDLNENKAKDILIYSYMILVLVCGDCFHILPRIYAGFTKGLDKYPRTLGFGKLVTSITMTIFYVFLFEFYRERYTDKTLTADHLYIYGLALLRILLCLFPQNKWLSENPSYLWGIIRNIPFVAMGFLIAQLFYNDQDVKMDGYFSKIPFAVGLSFVFYIPVVLFAKFVPMFGMFMLPKTLSYLFIIWYGYLEFTRDRIKASEDL